MRLFYLLMIAGLLGISCRQAGVLPDNVRTAAGKNRQELQRVLDHYDNDPLKQRAAMYLLENMPGHYTATSKLFASHKERLTLPARERYEAFKQQFPEVCQRVNLGYIASYLGITLPTLSRLRAE